MVESEQLVIAGLILHIFSLVPLSTSNRPVIAVFLLHGRKGSAFGEKTHAESILEQSRIYSKSPFDLVVIAFDHRNHGTRLRNPISNNGWGKDPRVNNERHAIDMYAIQSGTALDVSYLIDFLPAYLFPSGDRQIKVWGVAGISLGGHCAWLALGQDKRISFGISIIGCPDYLKLMEGRATKASVPFKPPYIPTSLLELVKRTDPASKPFDQPGDSNPYFGKKILVLSGGMDRLVPWTASEKFVELLEVGQNGVKRVIVQEGIGHECTKEMLGELVKFIGEEYLKE